MNLYISVKLFHVLAVILFVGGLFARQAVRSYAKKDGDIKMFAALNQGAGKIERLLVSNILLVGAIVIIPTIFVPRGRKFEPLLQADLAREEISAELRAAMDDPLVRWAHIYEEVAVIVIVGLMV